MAPRPQAAQRRNPSSQNQQLYELGKQGRKTGVTLPDTGVRDEHGMEPVDHLFSSPDKPPNGDANGRSPSGSDDEQDMEIDDASQMGPGTVRRMRERLSIPRSRSPLKTNLNSPARHNPHVNHDSSPYRGSVVTQNRAPTPKSARRLLDFSQGSSLKPKTNGYHSQVNGNRSQNGKLTNGVSHDEDSEDEAILRGRDAHDYEDEDDEEDMHVLDTGGADDFPPEEEDYEDDPEDPQEEQEEEEEEEQEDEEPPVKQDKPKGRGRKGILQVDESPLQPEEEEEDAPTKKRGRVGRPRPPQSPKVELAKGSPKRGRGARNSSDDQEDAAEERGTKRQRTNNKPKKETPAPKGKGPKRKSSNISNGSPAVIPRPPMPKGRGLQIVRREDLDGGGVRTTRSGRVSAKPLAFWKNEHYEYDEDEEETITEKNGQHIKLGNGIKGIVRVDSDDEAPKRKRRGGRPGRQRRRASDLDEEDEDRSDWEEDDGHVTGECIYWYPEYEKNPPQEEDQVEVIEEDLAISQAAIQMRDIKDATFRFAKTLTMPFFGSGIVDLPPHAEKKPKNARKMHMTFFVHYGKVEVTVAQTTFRIGKGGTWFVPRGNYYSIQNNTERPARLFFCQGCELQVQPEGQGM